MQQFSEQLSLERQQRQQEQEQEQLQLQQQQQAVQPHQFDPFYFTNLRRLHQHDNQQYKQQKQLQQKQQQQHQVEYYVVDADNVYDNDKINNNKNNKYKKSDNSKNNQEKSQSFIQHSNNNHKNNHNGNPNSLNMYNDKSNEQQQQQQMLHNFDVDPQDARNDFRLQLSDLNEAVKSVGATLRADADNDDYIKSNTNGNNNNNNNNNNNFNSDNAYDNKSASENETNETDANDNHAIVVRSQLSRTEANEAMHVADYVDDNDNGIDATAAIDIDDDAIVAGKVYENEDEHELSMDLPYGIQNVRKRLVRSVMPNTREYASKSTTYQSLCPTKRVTIPLETVGYKYRPSSYVEVTCAHNYAPQQLDIEDNSNNNNRNRVCSGVGFTCIQLNRTIHLIRRSKAASDECWEPEVRVVPSGCECMWPRHAYGDIVAYHDKPQKRLNSFTNPWLPATDYTPGVGYRQLHPASETPPVDMRQGIGYDFLFV